MSKCWLCSQEVSEKARNYKHHCKLFVMFEIGFSNWEQPYITYKGQAVHTSKEQFREMVLVRAGHAEMYVDFEGSVRFTARSISYSKLGQKGFDVVYENCLRVIGDDLLGCGKDDLHDEIIMRF